MHEHLEVHVLGGFLVHLADLIDGKFAGKHHTLDAEFLGGEDIAGRREVGKGGKVQFALEACLTRHVDKADILDDEAVGLGIALEALDEAPGGEDIAALDERVEGHIDAAAVLIGQVHHAGQLGGAEVFRTGTGGEVLEAEVGGVGPGGHAREEAGHVAGRGQEFRQSFVYHNHLDADGSPPDLSCRATAIISLILFIWFTSLAPGS